MVKMKCVSNWHSGQVLSVKHNDLVEHKQTSKQEKPQLSYLDNSLKHMSKRQERDQGIIWRRIDSIL